MAPLLAERAAPLEFVLPEALVATSPPEVRGAGRDDVRLLVSHAGSREVEHRRFADLAGILEAGDVLVVNTSATIPASFPVLRRGVPLELHLSTRLPAGLWIVELRAQSATGSRPFFDASEGDDLRLPEGRAVRLLTPYTRPTRGPARLWVARLDLPPEPGDFLARHGEPIAYGGTKWPLAAYQTIFATEPGSAEMPSAARAFTHESVALLVARGIEIVPVLLHAGVSSPESDEPPFEELYRVDAVAARRINSARRDGSRIFAVGTTVVRALETVVDGAGEVHPGRGWTDLVVTGERGARAVDGLLTGLHEPRSSHLAMLEAIAGRTALDAAYRAALDEGYLWHEFGDLHLVLP